MAKHPPKRLTDLFLRKKIKEPGRYTDGPASNGLSALARLDRYGRWFIYWDQRISIGGRATMLRLGKYPILSLREARQRAVANTRVVREGRDPRRRWDVTFEGIAMEYIELVSLGAHGVPEAAAARPGQKALIKYAFPLIGDMHPSAITSVHIVEILWSIWITKHKTARDLGGRISAIMKYAKAWGHCDSDPAQRALDGMFPVHVQTKHRKYVHHEILGEVIRIVAASDARPHRCPTLSSSPRSPVSAAAKCGKPPGTSSTSTTASGTCLRRM